MASSFVIAIVVAVDVTAFSIALAFFLRGFRRGPRGPGQVSDQYLARVHCRRCGRSYECEWVPGITFSAVRLGRKRYQRCRMCGRASLTDFERWSFPAPGKDPTRIFFG